MFPTHIKQKRRMKWFFLQILNKMGPYYSTFYECNLINTVVPKASAFVIVGHFPLVLDLPAR